MTLEQADRRLCDASEAFEAIEKRLDATELYAPVRVRNILGEYRFVSISEKLREAQVALAHLSNVMSLRGFEKRGIDVYKDEKKGSSK